jgi:hypothetical protein
MLPRLCKLIIAAGLALQIYGCKPSDSEVTFNVLLGSDFGVGLQLGAAPAEVTNKLGVATVRSSLLNGKVTLDTYLPKGETEVLAETPQLQLYYVDNQLTRIMNFYRPFDMDPIPPDPPFLVRPIGNLGLGSRKSDFSSKLGEPNHGVLKDQWRFTGKDGRTITIHAIFTDDPKTSDPTCTRMTIALGAKASESRGEQYEGK